MRVKLPIKITVLTVFCVLTVSVIAVLSITNYIQSTDAARETAHEFIERAERTTRENTEKLLGSARLLASSIANAPISSGIIADTTILTKFLRAAMYEVPEVYSAYIAFGTGRFVQAINLKLGNANKVPISVAPEDAFFATRVIDTNAKSGERTQIWHFFDQTGNEIDDAQSISQSAYDPRVRPWFKRALQSKILGASEIYIFSSLQQPGVTVSVPMRGLRGAVVGLDIPLESLANFVNDQKPGKHGIIAIVDSAKTLVAHPDQSKIIARISDGTGFKTVKLNEVSDDLLRAAARALENNITGQAQIVVKEGKYLASSIPVDAFPGDQWQIFSLAAIEDFTGPATKSIQKSVTIALIMLIVAIGLVILIANWISNPLIESSAFAESISELDLNAPAPSSSPLFEIQKLGHSMVAMRNAIGMFLRYAPRDLVRDLVVSGKTAEIGGSRQEVTIMFTDIEGFTALTEKQSPEEVLTQTSTYFKAMTEALEPYQTTIDKFIGDAIMAMWNAPIEDPKHIEHACLAMLSARKASEDLNAELAAQGLPILRTRFGLHTGDALVGNVGSPQRMQFTSLGPVVNLASRIEGLNKYYGTQLLVSDAVADKAPEWLVFRKVDVVEAVGTSIPVTLYELLGVRDSTSPFAVDNEAFIRKQKYEKAFMLYASRNFVHAQEIFQNLNEKYPSDMNSRDFAERCSRFQEEPPDATWQPINIFDKK